MAASFAIRSALPNEAKLLSDLALESKGYWGYDAEFLESCRQELTYTTEQLQSSDYNFRIGLTNQHSVIGFFALNLARKSVVDLEALFIKPTFIGQGWGKHLLNAAIDQAQSVNAKRLTIQGDPYAEAFYLANGAVKVAESESHSIPGRFLPVFEITL